MYLTKPLTNSETKMKSMHATDDPTIQQQRIKRQRHSRQRIFPDVLQQSTTYMVTQKLIHYWIMN